MTKALYVVLPQMQQAQIDTHCFGDCGKISLGVIDLGDGIFGLPCAEAICPYVERTMEEPCGTVEATQVSLFMRKLREETQHA